MSFCFLYYVVSENYRVQNSPHGGWGLWPAQGLILYISTTGQKNQVIMIYMSLSADFRPTLILQGLDFGNRWISGFLLL